MPDLWMDVDVALAEVPVNLLPLIDDTDFKSIEGAVAYNAAGMALRWHFVTPAGAYTVTSVTPTTAGDYDWTDQGDSGIYTIEIPASAGASINNDTEGVGWFTGVATGILPWRGPTIGFRAAGLNDALIESAWSATRGLTGTALPAAAADAAGGLPISDTGGLDLDAQVVTKVNTLIADADDIQTRLPAALVGGRMDASVGAIVNGVIVAATFGVNALDAVWSTAARTLTALTGGTVAADMRTAVGLAAADLDTQLDTLAAALVLIDDFVDDVEGRLTAALATALQAYALAIGRAVIAAGATTTAVPLTSVNGAAPSAVNDFYNGRVLIYTSGALTLQAVAISDYVGATTTLTTTASTAAPANTDTAVIV